MEEAVSEKHKPFVVAHKSDEDRLAYISASRSASSLIAKAQAKAWQTTCSFLLPKSNPKSVYSLFRSVAGSSFSFPSSPNFPNCSSPKESALVFADYLISHFSISQPKTLRSSARGYLSEHRQTICPEESHLSFCSAFSPAEFLAAAFNLSSTTATGPDKVAYPVLKYLFCSGMDFLLHVFNLSLTLHSFLVIWKTSIIPIHKMGKPLYSPASFRPISLISCVSKLLERIVLSCLLFFLESNSIFSPLQAGFRPGRSSLDQILYLSQSISDEFNKPRPGSQKILSTIDFSKAFDSVWHSVLLHKLISTGLPPCFACRTQCFLSDRRTCVVYQNHKSRSFKSADMFRKNPFLALYFFLFLSMIFLPLCLLPSAALFTLTTWPFGPPLSGSALRWKPHKELYCDWSAGLSTGVFLSSRANVRPPSFQQIPTKLISIPTSSYSTLASASTHSNFSWGHLRAHSILF